MTDFKNSKVFITGGNGFIGSWLVKRLLNIGADITCLIYEDLPKSVFGLEKLHERVKIARGNMEDAGLIKRIIKDGGFETVFHLAAQAIVTVANNDPVSTLKANILGTVNVLEACRLAGNLKSVVVATSDKAYGNSNDLPYKENHPLRGVHPYDVSKSCADLVSYMYFRSYGLPVSVVRCGNVIGGGDFHTNRILW